jgi:AraC-like DNA-binding protein
MRKTYGLKELVYPNKDCFGEYLLLAEANHFNIFNRSEICEQIRPMHRSDFYKISLIAGSGVLQINEQVIKINGHVLIFYNPAVSYYWHSLTEEKPSFYCYFDNHFLTRLLSKDYFQRSALFNPYIDPVYFLTNEQADEAQGVFEHMNSEIRGDYHHKYDILATFLQLLMQVAFKFSNRTERTSANKSAATRVLSGFLNLLERQFPVDGVGQSLRLKSPGDFAQELCIHVNHLNHYVKELTGKQTSEIIAARMITEARSLLRHSNAGIAEIAYMLGFEFPSNFTTFFRKHTKKTPKLYRNTEQITRSDVKNI